MLGMALEDLLNTFGFPVAVAAFALWNSYKHEQFLQSVLTDTLKENTAAINKLSDLIDAYTKREKEVAKDEI